MNNIYILQLYTQNKVWALRKDTGAIDEELLKKEYQRYKLKLISEGAYPSLAEAEAAMTGYIGKHGWNVYCCYIAEVPMGVTVYNFLERNYSLRLYDGKGVKLDERLFKSRPFANCLTTSEYYGRKPEECRFKPGDVVEFMKNPEKSCLGVVERIILEYEEGAEPIGDESDDGYVVREVDKHSDNIEFDEYGEPCISDHYVSCMEVFKPHFPIPKIVRKRIENIRRMISERYGIEIGND